MHFCTYIFLTSSHAIPLTKPLRFIHFIRADGLYVLLRPEKKNGPLSSIPRHLQQALESNFRPDFVPWSLSGPQFPKPTAIQQRYCYPKGNHEYCFRKGGSLWTMYGPDGKENCDYRLLHVYFSTKRAQNKGVSAVEIEEEKTRQRDDMSSDGLSTASKRRKTTSVHVERVQPSSWQRGPRPHSSRVAPPPHVYGPPPNGPPHHGPPRRDMGYHPDYIRHYHHHPHYHLHHGPPPHGRYSSGRPIIAPPSPCRSQHQGGGPTAKHPMYVSPNSASTASHQGAPQSYPGNGYPNEREALESFDAADVDASVRALSMGADSASHPRQESFGNSPTGVFRSRESINNDPPDYYAHIQQILEDPNFEDSVEKLAAEWQSAPEIQLNTTFSKDYIGGAYPPIPKVQEDNDSVGVLVQRLEELHNKIRKGILDHSPEERAALIEIYTSWAREITCSPLEPLPQGGAAMTPSLGTAAAPPIVSFHSEFDTARGPGAKNSTAAV